jgi:hypothetical protein
MTTVYVSTLTLLIAIISSIYQMTTRKNDQHLYLKSFCILLAISSSVCANFIVIYFRFAMETTNKLSVDHREEDEILQLRQWENWSVYAFLGESFVPAG